MLRFVTENSVYIVDDDLLRYMRLQRTEAGRQSWEKTEAFSWRLADNAWLPLRSFCTTEIAGIGQCLRLFTPDAVHGVLTSPIVHETGLSEDGRR